MSASQAAAESSSSRARQHADAEQEQEPQPPQRRWAALVSRALILAAGDARARAIARGTNVDFDRYDPPKPSYLVLHPTRIVALDTSAGEFAYQPSAYILAADRSGHLLFRVTKPNPDPGVDEPAEDETMYLCNTHFRKATQLRAVPYSGLCIEAQPHRSVGLIADTRPSRRGDFWVVQLHPRPADSIRLGDKLLYYDTEKGDWFVKAVHTTSEVRRHNLRGETGVLAHAGRLYWLALRYGIFFCDPFAQPSRMSFVPLPDGCRRPVPTETNRAYVAQRRRLAPSQGHLRFVEVRGLSYEFEAASPSLTDPPSVMMWTLVDPEGEEPWWRPEHEVRFADVWAHASYHATFGLSPGEVPHVALVDPDDHSVVYFLHTESSKIFGLDLRTKQTVSCEDCSERDDRPIILQNSRPIIDAWEQSAPPPRPRPDGPSRQTQYRALLAAGCMDLMSQSVFRAIE